MMRKGILLRGLAIVDHRQAASPGPLVRGLLPHVRAYQRVITSLAVCRRLPTMASAT